MDLFAAADAAAGDEDDAADATERAAAAVKRMEKQERRNKKRLHAAATKLREAVKMGNEGAIRSVYMRFSSHDLCQDTNKHGQTVVHIASFNGQLECLKRLLSDSGGRAQLERRTKPARAAPGGRLRVLGPLEVAPVYAPVAMLSPLPLLPLLPPAPRRNRVPAQRPAPMV